jgi:hypothetical protein
MSQPANPAQSSPLKPATDFTGTLPAAECGRICAGAGEAQRDLQEHAATYGELFPSNPFDAALFSTVALANAFCAPWMTAHELRIANRASLWAFALDWLIDYLATSREDVDDAVRRCLAVADGAPPAGDDQLARFLADIRTELAGAPAFEVLRPIWREELRLMLEAMAREWDWQASRASGGNALPTFEEYLANADNICFSFVFVSHWILTEDAARLVPDGRPGIFDGPPPVALVDEVRAAGREVQKVIRLLNDLGTYQRDVSWGDLNPLMLGVSRDEVTRHISVLVERCQELLDPLRAAHPRLADFLDRYIGFNTGFYRLTDYWGKL